MPHDLIHVLSGIDTSPVGEIVVAGFEAGMSSSQFGFELLLEVVLDFHLGFRIHYPRHFGSESKQLSFLV